MKITKKTNNKINKILNMSNKTKTIKKQNYNKIIIMNFINYNKIQEKIKII